MENSVITSIKQRMGKTILSLKDEMTTLRTGRANAGILDHVTVELYGSRMPIKQMASINVPEARMLVVQPWDKKSLGAIDKAIREADLGLNPISDGLVLRVPMPELTEQRRKELVKVLHKFAEGAKVAIRNIRREAMEQLKNQEKHKEVSKDELKILEKSVQDQTDLFTKEVDQVAAAKETEILQV
ncbi:MAG: ribosome recycling factor [Magnetococcales bacterium]|nr:ribosome recycling factor [Magnetococcales bacterium]